jgi:hypothetical protein
VDDWLRRQQAEWNDRFDRLDQHLAQQHQTNVVRGNSQNTKHNTEERGNG